jgi:hypothetical protein
MDALSLHDGSEELRIEIKGYLSGQLIDQLKAAWQASQNSIFWRRLVVDIASLKGYDAEGHLLLHEMYQYGAVFAAPTPQSLDFLEEITSGTSSKAIPAAVWHNNSERSSFPRPRHRAAVANRELKARYR